LTNGCETAVSDYKVAAKSRAQERSAVKDARDILGGVSESSEQRIYGTNNETDTDETSLLQIASDAHGSQVVKILKLLAKKQQSTELSQLVSRVDAVMRFGSKMGDAPFAEVNKMLSKLIAKLESEASSESKHKDWCDKNTEETEAKTEQLTNQIERKTAGIDKSKADAAELNEQIEDAKQMLAELLKRKQEMDDVRHDEHLAFVKTEADLKQGLNGIRMAVTVLHNYYATGEEDEASDDSFLQVESKMLPVRPSHVKAQAAGQDIITMLGIVEQDFGKNLAETQTSEQDAAAEYAKQQDIDNKDQIGFEEEIKFKTNNVATINKFVNEGVADRDWVQEELDAVVEFAKGVHESCDVKPETSEDRKIRRDNEIAGLNDALKALKGEAFLQRRKLRGAEHHIA